MTRHEAELVVACCARAADLIAAGDLKGAEHWFEAALAFRAAAGGTSSNSEAAEERKMQRAIELVMTVYVHRLVLLKS